MAESGPGQAQGRGISRRRVVAAGSLGALALAACGVPSAPATRQDSPPVTVTFLPSAPSDMEMAPQRADDFAKAHPNVKIDVQGLTGSYDDKVETLLAANTLGDVMVESTSGGFPQVLFLRQVVQRIDSFVQRDKLDLKQWFPQIVEAARVDGKQFALPFDGKMARVAVWVNKTMFDRAGLKLPDATWTVDQYMNAAVKLTKGDDPDKDWGFATHLQRDFSYVQAYVRRWGGDVFDKSGKKATLNGPEARAALQWAYDMYYTRRVAPTSGDETKLFRNGHGAIMLHRDFNLKPSIAAAAQQQGFEYWASVGPKGPTGRRGGFWDFRACWMWSQSKVQDAAWEFQKFICDKESGLAHALQAAPGTSTTPGARPDVVADPRFLNHPVYPRQVQEMEAESMKSTEPEIFPANLRVDELSDAINSFLVRIIAGETQPTPSFMKDLDEAVQRVLDLPLIS